LEAGDWCVYGKKLAAASLTQESTLGIALSRQGHEDNTVSSRAGEPRLLCIPNAGQGDIFFEDPFKFRLRDLEDKTVFKQQTGTVADHVRRQYYTQFDLIATTVRHVAERVEVMIDQAEELTRTYPGTKFYLAWEHRDSDWDPKLNPYVEDDADDQHHDTSDGETYADVRMVNVSSPVSQGSPNTTAMRIAPALNAESPPRSESSKASLSSVVSVADFDAAWLQPFSPFTTSMPSPAYRDHRRWDRILTDHLRPLKEWTVTAVVQFVTDLMKVNAMMPNGAIAWVGYLDVALWNSVRAMIVKVTGREVQAYCEDVSMREMVVALGRGIETKNWTGFVRLILPCFADMPFDAKSISPEKFWPLVHTTIFRLSVIIPLVGRPLHATGATLYHRKSHLVELLTKLIPELLLNPLLERLYSPESKDKNKARNLPAEASEWKWSSISEVLLLLGEHATSMESEQRDSHIAAMEYNSMFSTTARAKSLSVMHYQSDDGDDFYDETPLVSAMRPQATARHKAYGASGSGQPSPMLEARIHKSVRQQESGRFDKQAFDASKEPCYTFALKGVCPKQDTCQFNHPTLDSSQTKLVDFLRHRLSKATASTHGLEVSFDDNLETTSESPGSLSEISQALSGVKLD
jgi:hypothetical protein